MDQAARVKRFEGRKSRKGERHGLGRWKGPAPQALRERLALEELYRDVESARVFPNLVKLTNVRMVDRGGGARLPAEAAHRGFVGEFFRNHLEGDGSIELFVVSRVDDPHPALSELRHHTVSSEALGDRPLESGGTRGSMGERNPLGAPEELPQPLDESIAKRHGKDEFYSSRPGSARDEARMRRASAPSRIRASPSRFTAAVATRRAANTEESSGAPTSGRPPMVTSRI